MTAPTTTRLFPTSLPRTAEIRRFGGQIVLPGDDGYDRARSVWNGMVDRRPAVILRCASTQDVQAAVRFGREAGFEIGVKCGGHNIGGLAVPDGGLMIDLGPMRGVCVDPAQRRAYVQGGSLLGNLDRAAAEHGLATTAGNVSHTGVGGLTLGGGMGWLARQFGLACDNVAAYTVVTADGRVVRACETENADLFWGLRGGGGNFGIVTEFEFRLHPIDGRALLVDLTFDAAGGAEVLRAWRDLLAGAPREATLTASAATAPDLPSVTSSVRGRPVVRAGFVWAGDPADGRRYLREFRGIGTPAAERVEAMSYVALQSMSDSPQAHGQRRYSKGHYLTELSDGAIDAFLARGLACEESVGREPEWSRLPNGSLTAFGGAIAGVSDDESAFSHRRTLVEWNGGTAWVNDAEDTDRIARSRAYSSAVERFANGVYVNSLGDEGQAGVRRAYPEHKLVRLAALKRRFDPENVFHLNQNIRPAA